MIASHDLVIFRSRHAAPAGGLSFRHFPFVISLSHTELATSACAAAHVERRLNEATSVNLLAKTPTKSEDC
jgi:hypothetical protein